MEIIITRDTMRANGKTVGQAMDEDAAFLRSVGIDAKDGQPTFDEKRVILKDKVRNVVLDALDNIYPDVQGWKDGELTVLFIGSSAVYSQVNKLKWKTIFTN